MNASEILQGKEKEEGSFLDKQIRAILERNNPMPKCFVCGRIFTSGLDYIDTDRATKKVCLSCIFEALDYYMMAKRERMQVGAKS